MTSNPDFDRLLRVTHDYDSRSAARPDADGKTCGTDTVAIQAMARVRADLVLGHLSPLPKVLTPGQLATVRQEMITMWCDGFCVGALSRSDAAPEGTS